MMRPPPAIAELLRNSRRDVFICLAPMIMPDWQYPHCGTSCRIQAACTAFPARVAAIPSTVVTFLPAAADSGVEQERTGCPSRCTVHAPHWAMPQPNLVPVRWSESRSTHKRGVSGPASTLRGLPLTMKETMKAPLGKTMDLSLNLIPADPGSPSTQPRARPFLGRRIQAFQDLILSDPNRF